MGQLDVPAPGVPSPHHPTGCSGICTIPWEVEEGPLSFEQQFEDAIFVDRVGVEEGVEIESEDGAEIEGVNQMDEIRISECFLESI